MFSKTFEQLLVAEMPKLRRYARVLTQHPSDADDLLQDTLARALAKRDLFEPGTNLRAWTFSIMHNLYVSKIKHIAFFKEGIKEDIDFTRLEPALVLTSIEPTIVGRQAVNKVWRAIMQLPDIYREVIWLIGIEDLSYFEAADLLDAPVGTIRSRLSRAREILRQQFSDERRTLDVFPVSIATYAPATEIECIQYKGKQRYTS